MKKIIVVLSLFLFFASNINTAQAYCHYHGHYCSSCVYVVRSDSFQEEVNLKNTKNYYLLQDTIINYYSNGSRRTYYNYSIYKNDGTLFVSDCSDVKHILHNKKDYFLIKKGRYYKILDSKGIEKAQRQYVFMQEIEQNKILVKVNKNYGVIDINENIIVPIKYKEFKKIGNDLYLTKLNGYYGLKDSSNNTYLKDEYDKIKPLYDTYLIKKEGKYGLVDIKGKIILEAQNDKIKKLGEYIVVKNNKRYEIYDSLGNKINNDKYKKIKLERNQLKVYKEDNWEVL